VLWSVSPDVSKQSNILICKYTTFRYDAVTLQRLKSLTQQYNVTFQTIRAPTVLPACRLQGAGCCSLSVCVKSSLQHCNTSNTDRQTDRHKQTNKQFEELQTRVTPTPCKTDNLHYKLKPNVQRLS